jgi:CheY-like chemotaxis protein
VLPAEDDNDMFELALGDIVDDQIVVGILDPPPLAAHHTAPARLSILLVDDDPALITLYGRTFGHAGHVGHTAENGEQGYVRARALRPDVIVSDIAMPKKNGWDLLASVRNDPRLAETPFLLLSCHGDFLRGLSQVSAGANDYIEKGIRAGALKERLEAAVAIRARLTTWTDTPPPAFHERVGSVGLFALFQMLSRTRADGEVFIADGWTKVHLWLAGGNIVHCLVVEADGTSFPGPEAIVTALGLSEGDVQWRPGAFHRAGRSGPHRRGAPHDGRGGGAGAQLFAALPRHPHRAVPDGRRQGAEPTGASHGGRGGASRPAREGRGRPAAARVARAGRPFQGRGGARLTMANSPAARTVSGGVKRARFC